VTQHELIERMVDRMLYTIEQYTSGATEPLSELSEARYDAMVDACAQQLTGLLAQCLSLTQEKTA
jgi:hypothetical protein